MPEAFDQEFPISQIIDPTQPGPKRSTSEMFLAGPFDTRKLAMKWNTLTGESGYIWEGTIKKLTDKGFGFIRVGNGKDLFFHSKSLQGVSYEELSEGQKVSFTEGHCP